MLWWLTHITASNRKLRTYPRMLGPRAMTYAVTSALSAELDSWVVITGTLRLRTSTVMTVAKIPSERASSLPLLRPRVSGSEVKMGELAGVSIWQQIKEESRVEKALVVK